MNMDVKRFNQTFSREYKISFYLNILEKETSDITQLVLITAIRQLTQDEELTLDLK